MTRKSFFLQGLVSALSLTSTCELASASHSKGAENDAAVEGGLARRAMPAGQRFKGEPEDCAQFYRVQVSGEGCDGIIKNTTPHGYRLTKSTILSYNPGISSSCAGLKRGDWICVKTGSSPAAPAVKAQGGKSDPVLVPASAAKDSTDDDEGNDDDGKKASAKKGAKAGTDDDNESTGSTKKSTKKPTTRKAAPKLSLDAKVTFKKNPKVVSGLLKYAIVGADSKTCVNRMEITDLQDNHPDTFNLLVLALAEMHAAKATDPWSYFQLSGIHGAPYTPWPLKSLSTAFDYDDKNSTLGYCVHRSVIFGHWHRPYMLALEQAVYANGKKIVQRFKGPSRKKYLDALELLRWPYWDWANKETQSHLPKCAKEPTIKVMQPNAKGVAVSREIDNPFYTYVFKGKENEFLTAPFNTQKGILSQTNRRPKNALGKSNEEAADNAMHSGYSTRRKQTYNALISEKGFNAFGNDLENLHNDVHVQVGGNGILSYISLAAYEPLFWLHHNNIDRMLAMWQAANPGEENYLNASDAAATYQRPVDLSDVDAEEDEDAEEDPDSVQNDSLHKDSMDTPLYPWMHKNGQWWSSRDIQDASDIWKFKYGYPEVPCSYIKKTPEQLDTFVTEKINELYMDKPLKGSTKSKKGKNSERGAAALQTMEWDVNILIDQSELCGTFIIYLFLGQPPADPKDWDNCKTKVGTLSLLGAPKRKRISRVEAATVPLTPALRKMGVNGTDAEVSAYLKEKLVWRCWNVNGADGVAKEIEIKSLKTLKIAVTETKVTLPVDNAHKPKVGAAHLMPEVTKDKKGGAKNEQELAEPKKLNGKTSPLRKDLLPIASQERMKKKAEWRKWKTWKTWKEAKLKKEAEKLAAQNKKPSR
ncbi:hypothetical protein DRE_04317 [Drechslerella stenobrocha 248]|uniref:tyrosinase n=1 Tax=Drechslerella stenobrocha 248 TaxID=1043628 RepID=W7HSW3_9PEZI|nr:hypothetical protein DRE_04317 [Drechslerella stenobrocha 248]